MNPTEVGSKHTSLARVRSEQQVEQTQKHTVTSYPSEEMKESVSMMMVVMVMVTRHGLRVSDHRRPKCERERE